MRLLYSFAIRCLSGIYGLAALFGHEKARLWWNGRNNQWEKLKSPDTNEEWIWMHVSSLGEFEQGLPVIENLKKNFPQHKLLLTFFSPSGYEMKKDFELADKVAYLPSDTMVNAKKLVTNFKIKAAFFVLYDFWFNYMKVLKDNDIPLFYVSVNFQKNHYFFKFYASWFRKQLKNVKHFFVQNEDTKKLLNSIDVHDVTITGNTRFDRVFEIARQSQSFPEIEKFISGRKCIIAGSTWPSDEKFVIPFLKKIPEDYCFIIAPHDISESHVNHIISQLDDYQLYTDLDVERRCKVLVINTIGILKKIYKYARFVYIGGGFYTGIHNTQEALVFDCPVVIGPKYNKFMEAVDLVNAGGMFSINDNNDYEEIFNKLIYDESFYKKASSICHDYVQISVGATEKTMDVLRQLM